MVSFPNSLNPKAWEVDISISMLDCSGVRAIVCGGEVFSYFFFFFFLNNFIYKTITYTTYSINYTYIVLATNTTDTYTYTNYAYTTLRYMYYNTININLIYGWRVYKVLFN